MEVGKGVITMIDEKSTKQSMSCNRTQRATINISGIPGDDDDELLEMMYQIIKTERERGRSMQKSNSTENKLKSSK